MSRPLASLSLDLDNKWSYMKTHGDEGWESFPSYLDLVVPRVLEMLAKRNLRITFFIVGQDAERPENTAALRSIAEAGHEIGNHSFHHEPWLHLYSRAQLAEELGRTEAAIEHATGAKTRGFRGPGFSFSEDVLDELLERGYAYDASTFPTFLGPLARLYYFFTARLDKEQREERKQLFGSMAEGLRRLKPYKWRLRQGELLEIPVTTMPIFRAPIHASYVLYLAGYSKTLAKFYFWLGMTMCRLRGVEPSILLHPLDFLGKDDDQGLDFFPAMQSPRADKLGIMEWVLDALASRFEVLTMEEHAAAWKDCRVKRQP
ncbi:MAG: polysaccharide deacetylase family protein [Planctomycetales bacterium]|nr:polysaccharide deacetylase family protein [Planctomycetales bacterium]